MGLPEAYLSDPTWEVAPEELPDGSRVLVRDISKALAGEDFLYYPEGEKYPEEVHGVESSVWNYYMRHFKLWLKFGLFRGGGPADYPPWYPDFLAYMSDLKEYIDKLRDIRNGGGEG